MSKTTEHKLTHPGGSPVTVVGDFRRDQLLERGYTDGHPAGADDDPKKKTVKRTSANGPSGKAVTPPQAGNNSAVATNPAAPNS